MSEKWLRDLDVLDHLEMPSSVKERVGRTAPPSPSGQPLGRRLITIGVAFTVFVGSGLFAWRAFRASTPTTPSSTQPSSIDGTILWPEQTGADLAATQALADSGDPKVAWRLDPQAVATRFAEDVLGWGPAGGTYEASLGRSESTPSPAPAGALTATLSQRAIPCPTPPPGEQVSCPPPFATETLWLRQAGSTGASGVWSVEAAFASGLNLTLEPGDVLRNGHSSLDGSVSFPATAANTSGFTAQGGFFLGTDGECSTGRIEGVRAGGLSIDVKVGTLGWSASGCPPESIALAWIATASPPSCPQGASCAFVALVSPDLSSNYAHLYSLTAIPILVSALGEQSSPAPAANSYVNPMGIPITVDYPAEWYAQSVSQDSNLDPAVTGPRQIGLVVSNTAASMPSPGVDSPSPGPLPEDPNLPSDFVSVTILARDVVTHGPPAPDSTLPLSMDYAKFVPGPANIRVLDAVVAGRVIEITVRAGPTASDADLARADALVASIRPSRDAAAT